MARQSFALTVDERNGVLVNEVNESTEERALPEWSESVGEGVAVAVAVLGED